MKSRHRNLNKILATLFAAIVFSSVALAQSNDPNFPTPLTANDLSGTIKARDIGDNRLTTYYFAFEGEQGDIFINVTTKNFDGAIDVFAADAMRPLTKMIIYADTAISETGRLAAILFGRRHRDASVAAAEVPEHILVGYLGQQQQGIDHILGRWFILDVGDGTFARLAEVDRFKIPRPNVDPMCDGSRAAWAGNDRLDGVVLGRVRSWRTRCR